MNETTVALSFVLAVLVVATVSSMRVAVAASLVAFACFNFFFLPPVGTFTIANTDDVVALLTLLAVSLIGSHLSQEARRRAQEMLAFAQERHAAEMVRKNAETKSALVASLSHDLKTPLTASRRPFDERRASMGRAFGHHRCGARASRCRTSGTRH
jgi:K+-sensing histidine kinase KdpD